MATYGYWAVLGGVFVTSFYSFRLLYLTFHGKERFRDAHPTIIMAMTVTHTTRMTTTPMMVPMTTTTATMVRMNRTSRRGW